MTAIALDDYHQLLCLLCPDFPYTLVQNAARIDLNWDKDPVYVKYGEFSRKLAILFFFSEFMNHSAQAFKSLDQHDTGRVLWRDYSALLTKLVQTKAQDFNCPDVLVIDEVLHHAERSEIMFNEFCVRLFDHPKMELALQKPPSYQDIRTTIYRLIDSLEGSKEDR
eukprot:TRINITY_DN3083_c0_g2_i1.p1 TRINITY_DN3083_c0_g2~~TRINITY_DN3083_c0_g2_i1.p1  ORF type:complete len:187 (+),score=22.80 TRINITY_DN3083_c0_g2_i1:66-563(+)